MMNREAMDIVTILDTCAEIEVKSAELYDLLAECFADCEEAARLWHKVAREEDNHANQFRLAARLKEGAIGGLNADLWKVNNMLRIVESIVAGVRKCAPSLEDALRSAIKLEESLATFHLDCIACCTSDSHRQLFRAMMGFDDGHMQCLRDAHDRAVRGWGKKAVGL